MLYLVTSSYRLASDWARLITPELIRTLYAHDSLKVGQYVQRWALAAASADLKVALCGYAGEYNMPTSWEETQWDSNYGRGRERIWFSL